MARRIPAKQILRLKASNLSQNQIVGVLHLSKTSVSDTLKSAREKGLAFEDVEELSDDEVYERLFPERMHEGPVFEDPDWSYIHKELARTGVTLKLLHAEYADRQSSQAKPYMSYDRFCKRYRDYTLKTNVVSRVGHKAGHIMEVDWSGPTMQLVDPITGQISKVYLFVACLPFSRYSYVEPTLDMKQDSWLMCHVHAFEFFGGVSACIVPDNLKCGVNTHPKEGEVVLNDAYEQLADHYSTAIIPARIRKPRDKPSAENEVWSAATYVIGALRNEIFTDMGTLKAAVAEKLAQHNTLPFSKRDGSRAQCFLEEEKPALRALPKEPFEICTWVYGRKVQLNSHVAYKKNYYSVSYLLVGKTVDLRITSSKVEIFFGNDRVSTHALFPSYLANRYSTHESDMPKQQSYSDWNGPRIRRWAERVGRSCAEVIDRIFAAYVFEEQAFNGCLAVLRLSHKYSSQRLEKACAMALSTGKPSPRYRDIEPILKTHQDKMTGSDTSQADNKADEGGYVRGADYYG